MKKIVALGCVLILIGMLTGCIDIIHVVSSNNSIVQTSIRYTLQKSIFEFAASMTGEQVDYQDFMVMGSDIFTDIADSQGLMKSFETPFDVGAEFTIAGTQAMFNAVEAGQRSYLPIRDGNRYTSEIPLMGSEDEEFDEYAMLFLSGAKYRLIVELSGDMIHLNNAAMMMQMRGEGSFPVTAQDGLLVSRMGSILVVEIPMLYLLFGEGNMIITLS